MTFRQMGVEDLQMVLGWAADEGWNPGLDDAAAFHAADPQGFFLLEVDGHPAAAISVVNHDAAHSFLGLYICRPMYRGQGLGLKLWTHALAHAGQRSVGLDGVPEQQANYARSGFTKAGRTVRYRGDLDPASTSEARVAGADRLPQLVAADRAAAGHDRTSFAEAWFRPGPTRKTLVLPSADGLAFATVRRCREGAKVGPFHAVTRSQAEVLLAACAGEAGAGPLFIDVPDTAPDLAALVDARAFQPVFETARMYRGAPPVAAPPPFHGVATLELG